MPGPPDDRYFGSKPGSSNRAFEEMVKTYGLSKATQVWHSMRNQRKAQGKTWKPSR